MLCIFENVHWIDPTTLELLTLAVIATAPVLFVITFRPEFSPPWLDRPNATLLRLNLSYATATDNRELTMLPYQVALIDPGASRHAGNWHAAGKAVGNVNLDWVRDYWAGKPLLPPWQDFLLPLNITGLVPATSAGRTERKMDHAKPLPGPETVLAFWRAAGPEKWYAADAAFDAQVRTRFLAVYEAAAAGHLAWDDTPEGALALLVVLDQFPRNMFRGSARAFAADALARKVAARAIDRGFDQGFAPPERCLFYLPFEHSESLADQERCVALNRATGDADAVKWAELHADIIRRFGRFPHRNRALGRATTPEEQAFLDGGGFAG